MTFLGGQTTGQKALSPPLFFLETKENFQGIQFCKHVSIGDRVVKRACFVLGSSFGEALWVTFPSPLVSLTPIQVPLCPQLACNQSLSAHRRLGNACWSWDTFSLNHNLSLTLVPMPWGSTTLANVLACFCLTQGVT